LPAREIGHTQNPIGPLAHPDKFFRPYGGGGFLDDRLFSGAAVDYLERTWTNPTLGPNAASPKLLPCRGVHATPHAFDGIISR
jgi:hypothetical protein